MTLDGTSRITSINFGQAPIELEIEVDAFELDEFKCKHPICSEEDRIGERETKAWKQWDY